MRTFPALEIRWPHLPSDEHLGRVLAVLDEDALVGMEGFDDGVRIYFLDREKRDESVAVVRSSDPTAKCLGVDITDEHWAERSQALLGSVTIGSFVVAPPWEIPEEGAPHVVIQPSMGFGTGHHASTRLCLDLLLRLDATGKTVLDVGTGSGVLALVAWRLGARDVQAIDRDPDALISARENVALNGADGMITLHEIDLADGPLPLASTFDIVLANLTGGALERHARALSALVVSDGGRLIAGGMQDDEAPGVECAFEAVGLRAVARANEDGWTAMTFRLTNPIGSTAR